MDKSLLVAVCVPTTDASGEDFKGKRYTLATGYPVGEDLILTARYILQPGPPHYRDVRHPVKVRWHYLHSEYDSNWIEISEQDIVWPGQNDFDAALIRGSRPRAAVGWGIVSNDRPRERMQWVSEGFPEAARYQKQRKSNPFSGQVRLSVSIKPYFELTVVETTAQDEDDWQGVCGMPVFIGRKILGVVQSVAPDVDAKRLTATPTWKLLEDEGFRKAIGFDKQTARIQRFKSKLVKTLAPSAQVIETLSEQLEISDELADLDGKQQAERLAERLLLETDVRMVITALGRAHHSLCKQQDKEGGASGATAALVKAAQLIVPAIYDYGVIQWAGNQQDIALLLLPAGIKTVAEIIMAGVDGRETRFRQRQHEHDQPEGELSLPQGPECGIDLGGTKARQALQDHLRRKFTPQQAQEFRRAVDDYLLATFPRSERGAPERTRRESIMLTADLLANKRDYEGLTFYMLFYLPQDTEEQNAMRSLIQSLKEDYPAIMFLGLDSDFEQERRDRDLVDHFCRLLPIKDSDPYLPSAPKQKQRFRIALSFPGEHRAFVEQVAAQLAEKVGRNQVLYDRYHKAEFTRLNLDTHLQHLYHQESELIVVFLCADYKKAWCGLEWRAIRDLFNQGQIATVMPFCFDETQIPGLFPSIDGSSWTGNRSAQEIAELILERLKINSGHIPA